MKVVEADFSEGNGGVWRDEEGGDLADWSSPFGIDVARVETNGVMDAPGVGGGHFPVGDPVFGGGADGYEFTDSGGFCAFEDGA